MRTDNTSEQRGSDQVNENIKQRIPPMSANKKKGPTGPSSEGDESPNKKYRSDSCTSAATGNEEVQSYTNDDSYQGEFDLCTPEGQIAASKAANPDETVPMTWEQAKHAARREYNRVNAARARKRHKDETEARDQEVAELKSQVEQLTRLNEALMKYISEQDSSSTQSVSRTGTSYRHALLEAASSEEKMSHPSAISLSGTDSGLLSQMVEGQVQANSFDRNHLLTNMLSDASLLAHERARLLNGVLCGPDLSGSAASSGSVGSMIQALQAQQRQAEAAMSMNAALQWSTNPGILPNQAANSPLQDFLRNLHGYLPSSSSSGAPK